MSVFSVLQRAESRPTKVTPHGLSAKQSELISACATAGPQRVLSIMESSEHGLSNEEVDTRRQIVGPNEVAHDRPTPAVIQFLRTFRNPFILILITLTIIMFLTDVIYAEDEADFTGVITIATMVLVSATLRFWQEYRTARDIEQLESMVQVTCLVTRSDHGRTVTEEIPTEDLVPGDIVGLAAGDMIPADVRVLRSKDLEVNQSMLSGEALPAEKHSTTTDTFSMATIMDSPTIGLMGTSVASGSASAVVIGTGENTYFGSMSAAITGTRPETSFDKGIKKVTFTLIRFMMVMVPVVFIVNGITKNWTDAFLFGVTTAVGLTPEMLPLVVTAALAKGARLMAKRKVIVKELNSIQNLGAMDILATDKTGTLTEDHIVLQRNMDTHGNQSERTLALATINSHFQTGLRNLLDGAILSAAGDEHVRLLDDAYHVIDEIPFDFARRRMSVIVSEHLTDEYLMVTKGAVEEMLEICHTEMVGEETAELSARRRAEIDRIVAEHNAAGERVLALGVKNVDPSRTEFSREDECEMTLVGLLTFLDPPKESAASAIESLRGHGTAVKVITGDNLLVAATVCREVGIDPGRILVGAEIEQLSDTELSEVAARTSVFAKIDPLQKARLVEALKAGGHTVGFMGDGINDAPALRAADVGISVDTAVDIAKESADIILLEKDLNVLEGGVLEGRRTYVNTMKYIKMTASSNFGNMFSVLVASALLPFIPMIPIVVLVQNLAYDLSMLTLPWDRVDAEDIAQPRTWDAKGLSRFMLRIGPLSSIFDITTFALMWFIFNATTPDQAGLFQSGWFIESIISQTLIVHMIRTRKIPFIQSRASISLILATAAVCVFGLVLPFTAWGATLGLVALPMSYFPWLVLTLLAYCVVTQIAKKQYMKSSDVWI